MNYQKISKEVRRKVVEMMYKSQTAHLGGCLSCVDILTVLYFKILRINPKRPSAENRDRFLLSKGHAVAPLYAVLAKRGFFSEKVLNSYCKNGGLPGHSTIGFVPGIEISTGSLGHGLSVGAGMALAGRRDKKKYRVFVLMSDGECQEGSTWEAGLFAAHHKLDNLVGIVDYNKLQAFGRIKDVLNLEPLAKKWKSFGWEVKEIDGHNFFQIERAFSKIPFKKEKPSLVIAHTIKGKGVSFIEDKMEWHYKNLTKEQYELALKELE
jgi:transketolase